ncbi:MAG: hypothetical protein H0T48_03845 [Gemmatimonadaceae bacterium]|nr:hypothetical protein [Gemmatimonadaceae bacterium]
MIVVAGVTACTENLDNSAGCPLLCPDQGGGIETVTIDPIVLDTTVSALAGLGTERSLLVATRGDTLDARAIIRFDTIPARYRASTDTATTAITAVDSVLLQMRVDTSGGKIPGPITLDAYDVDSPAADSLTDALIALFTPDRLIASRTYAPAELKDTVFFALPGSAILQRRGSRLRLGLRARGQGSVQFRIVSTEGAAAPTLLSFRVTPDTAVRRISLLPFSSTPTDQPALAASLDDYTILARGTSRGPANALNVGGLPARRVYLRFEIPRFLVDSVDLIRASLLLTQRPNIGVDAADTVLIIPHVSLATRAVTDIAKASQITAIAVGDTLRIAPRDSGLKIVEVASVVGLWRGQDEVEVPRALVLLSTTEGQSPLEARFFSVEASPELRPRLRISYSTRKSRGLP